MLGSSKSTMCVSSAMDRALSGKASVQVYRHLYRFDRDGDGLTR